MNNDLGNIRSVYKIASLGRTVKDNPYIVINFKDELHIEFYDILCFYPLMVDGYTTKDYNGNFFIYSDNTIRYSPSLSQDNTKVYYSILYLSRN